MTGCYFDTEDALYDDNVIYCVILIWYFVAVQDRFCHFLLPLIRTEMHFMLSFTNSVFGKMFWHLNSVGKIALFSYSRDVSFVYPSTAFVELLHAMIELRFELIPPREGSATWLLLLHFFLSPVSSFFNRRSFMSCCIMSSHRF